MPCRASMPWLVYAITSPNVSPCLVNTNTTTRCSMPRRMVPSEDSRIQRRLPGQSCGRGALVPLLILAEPSRRSKEKKIGYVLVSEKYLYRHSFESVGNMDLITTGRAAFTGRSWTRRASQKQERYTPGYSALAVQYMRAGMRSGMPPSCCLIDVLGYRCSMAAVDPRPHYKKRARSNQTSCG